MQYSTFCAANSGSGFLSFFDEMADEKSTDVYYIKGGPGCGKSTFLKEIAADHETAELIYCSGDPQSLDAVYLPKQKTLIFDATAPHSFEPKYPAIGGNIIDLGIVWEPKEMNRARIIELFEYKREIYKNVYGILNAAQELQQTIDRSLQNELKSATMDSLSRRILQQNGLWSSSVKNAVVTNRFLSAISSDGLITLGETINTLAPNIILIEDRWQIAHHLMARIDQKLCSSGIDHINSHHPLLGKGKIHHILIPSASLSILTKDGIFPMNFSEEQLIRRINMASFINDSVFENIKNKLTFLKRMERELMKSAVEQLKYAKKLHTELEQEYLKGCHFDRADRIKKEFKNKLYAQT